MITITTLTNSFILNGSQYQKGSLVVTPTAGGAKIGSFYDSFQNISVDGRTYATAEELHTALDTKLFKSGGGNGSGVAGLTWDDTSTMTDALKIARRDGYGSIVIPLAVEQEHAVNLSQLNTALGLKVDKEDGKSLTSNDFSDAYMAKLDAVYSPINF